MLAAQNGHWELGAFLVDRARTSTPTSKGWTALHQVTRIRRTNIGFLPAADRQGNDELLDLVKKLIAKGAKVNARDDQGLP